MNTPSNAGIRLAKRLAEQINCSRSQAEQYIEGGWVRVNGSVQDSPQHRVTDERIELDKNATLLPTEPTTILLHKPPGYSWDADPRSQLPSAMTLLESDRRSKTDASGIRLLSKHLKGQACITPLESAASGLIVLSQDVRVQRKLWDDANLVEFETIVEVRASVDEDVMRSLNQAIHAPTDRGERTLLNAKVALSKSSPQLTGLRFACKGSEPGRIAMLCEHHGLEVVGMKRIRVGRVPLADLALGQWRFLQRHERF